MCRTAPSIDERWTDRKRADADVPICVRQPDTGDDILCSMFCTSVIAGET
jgi:hypothetical protein